MSNLQIGRVLSFAYHQRSVKGMLLEEDKKRIKLYLLAPYNGKKSCWEIGDKKKFLKRDILVI